LCLPMLIKNGGKLLQPHLTEEELDFVLESCKSYISESLESVLEESEEQLKSTSEIKQSSSEFRRRLSTGVVFEKRQDIVMWKVIKLLFGKPGIRNEMKVLIQQILPAGSTFLHYFKKFQDYCVEHLCTSMHEQQAKDEQLRKLWNQNEDAKQEIENLSKLLDEQNQDLKSKVAAKDLMIHFNEGAADRLNRKCKNDIRKKVYDSECKMIIDLKNSKIKQERYSAEIKKLEDKFKSLLKTNLKEEKDLRAKKLKVETQLISWLSKYDADIGEKQVEYDEIMAGFNEERQQMEELQEQFDVQDEEYTRLMQEKAEEEQAIFEKKMYLFICNRSARRIQRCWRAYKERKLAHIKALRMKRKEKRGKKKKK
ncbi:hypothetical protein L9F63_012037, partial [Diploptera punctata]